MIRQRLPLALLAAFAGATLTIAASAASAEQTITIENFTFKPAALTIHAGDKVIFKNVDDIPHSVVLTDGSFHSKALDTNDAASLVFDKIGEHVYFCGLHPHMQGKITVVP